MIPLSMVNTGETGLIKRITGNENTKHFLENLGFTEGSNVTVVSEIGGNIIVKIKESRVAIDKSMASRIYI